MFLHEARCAEGGGTLYIRGGVAGPLRSVLARDLIVDELDVCALGGASAGDVAGHGDGNCLVDFPRRPAEASMPEPEADTTPFPSLEE